MIIIIAAIAKNNAIGKNNALIWHLPADLKRFKKITSGHHILMGRKTFESIGKPLPNRTSIVITTKKNYQNQNKCIIANSIEEAIKLAKNDNKIFIIGGAQIYKQVLEKDLADRLDITLIDKEFEADVFFPKIDKKKWKQISREDFKANEKNKYNYSFISYKRAVKT